MTHTTKTSRTYYSPVFLDGESYDEMMAHLENDGLAWAIDYARQWDYGDEHEDDYRDTVSEFGHEWEYGPMTGDWSPTRYWLVVSRSAAYAYLVRDA